MQMNPQYPVYIPSKGRWESRYTARSLEEMKVPYFIVVEPQERSRYERVCSAKYATILELPWSNLPTGGLVAARNWIREHSMKLGTYRHWQLDDNIDGFVRLWRNTKYRVGSGTIFRAAEDFVDRYTNVAIAGFHYDFFAKRKQKIPPFYVNTRVYSCSLIRNDIEHRWRDTYNDDTDICMRCLRSGYCTVLFLAFLACKKTTMTVKGGNTDIYQGDGRKKMAESLKNQHPEIISKITKRFGHDQHYVDYRIFQNSLHYQQKLTLRPGVNLASGNNEYGMVLKDWA
jgi:TET-associated glycosyltransferase-like protein